MLRAWSVLSTDPPANLCSTQSRRLSSIDRKAAEDIQVYLMGDCAPFSFSSLTRNEMEWGQLWKLSAKSLILSQHSDPQDVKTSCSSLTLSGAVKVCKRV